MNSAESVEVIKFSLNAEDFNEKWITCEIIGLMGKTRKILET